MRRAYHVRVTRVPSAVSEYIALEDNQHHGNQQVNLNLAVCQLPSCVSYQTSQSWIFANFRV
jgi:hypothetical protein